MTLPKIPVRIDPCPVVEAVAELKIESAVDPDAIYGIIYKSLKDKFHKLEKLPILQLPAALRMKDPNLRDQPYYRLSRDNYNLLIGPRVVAFANVNAYMGWTDFSREIMASFSLVEGANIIKHVRRIGMRYINFFENMDIYQHIELGLKLGDNTFDGHEKFIRLLIPSDKFKNLLQVANSTTFQIANTNKTGSVIDIDTFVEGAPHLNEFHAHFPDLLSRAHEEEKKLFFSLLRPDFLASLSPEYEGGI